MHDLPIDLPIRTGVPATQRATTVPRWRIYRVPWLIRALAWLSVLVLGVLTLGSLALPVVAPGWFAGIYVGFCGALVFGQGTWALFAMARRMAQRFRADEHGLVCIGPDDTAMLPWVDIGRIRERPLLQRLDVSDRSGERVMGLAYQIGGFEELAEVIGLQATRASSADEPAIASAPDGSASARAFHRNRLAAVAAPMLGPAVIALSLWYFGGVLILFLIIAAFAVVGWLFAWRTVRVGPTEIVVSYPLRARRIPLRDVRGVELRAVVDRWVSRRIAVDLSVVRGGVVRFQGCREGAIPLYKALERAVRSAAAWRVGNERREA